MATGQSLQAEVGSQNVPHPAQCGPCAAPLPCHFQAGSNSKIGRFVFFYVTPETRFGYLLEEVRSLCIIISHFHGVVSYRYSKLGALSPPKGKKFRSSDPAPGCNSFPLLPPPPITVTLQRRRGGPSHPPTISTVPPRHANRQAAAVSFVFALFTCRGICIVGVTPKKRGVGAESRWQEGAGKQKGHFRRICAPPGRAVRVGEAVGMVRGVCRAPVCFR